MSDAARAMAATLFPQNMTRLMYDTQEGQRVVCVAEEWREELAACLDAFVTERTAALRAALKAGTPHWRGSRFNDCWRVDMGDLASNLEPVMSDAARDSLEDALDWLDDDETVRTAVIEDVLRWHAEQTAALRAALADFHGAFMAFAHAGVERHRTPFIPPDMAGLYEQVIRKAQRADALLADPEAKP